MFAKRLDRHLKKNHISNYKISKATNISDSLIGYWRKGTKAPTLHNMIKLCDYLDVPMDYLAGRMSEDEFVRLTHYQEELSKKGKK